MYNRRFFASKLGMAALVSIAAMAVFNIVALTHLSGLSDTVLVLAPMVELA